MTPDYTALHRALTQGVTAHRHPEYPRQWIVTSGTEAGRTYTAVPSLRLCTCAGGYYHHRPCKHLAAAAVLEQLTGGE